MITLLALIKPSSQPMASDPLLPIDEIQQLRPITLVRGHTEADKHTPTLTVALPGQDLISLRTRLANEIFHPPISSSPVSSLSQSL